MLIQQTFQVSTVLGFLQPFGLYRHPFRTQPLLAISNFFQAGYFHPLTLLDGMDKLRGLNQAVVGSRIQPGKTTAQQFNLQVTPIQIHLVRVVISSSPRAEGLTSFAIATTSVS